jgi:CRP-like cAMP-binding protein
MPALLDNVRVLQECTDQERQALRDACQPVTVQEGDRIFEAGDKADFLYFVADGVVELRFTVKHYLSTNEIAVDRIRKGEVVGWSALAESKAYSLAAVVVQGGELLRAPAADVRNLCSDNHHFGYVLMKNISKTIAARFDLTQKMLFDVIQTQLDERERRM